MEYARSYTTSNEREDIGTSHVQKTITVEISERQMERYIRQSIEGDLAAHSEASRFHKLKELGTVTSIEYKPTDL